MQEGGNPHYGRVLAIADAGPRRTSHRSRSDLLMNLVFDNFLSKDYFINQDYDIINQNIYFDALVYA